MKVLIFADLNIAGNNTLLWHMLNDHTDHEARCVVFASDYLAYDKDIELSRMGETLEASPQLDEAVDLINNWAEFYHIIRCPIPLPGVDWKSLLRPDNCVFQYFGSFLRSNRDALERMHVMSKFHGISYWDWSMLECCRNLFYHINIMYPCDDIESCEEPEDGVVSVCHAPTNRAIKGTDVFLEIMSRLEKRHKVKTNLIEGVSNAECMKRKRSSQICFDSINEEQGIYGLTALESMAMNQVAMCCMNNFGLSVVPDCPVVPITAETLERKLEYFITHEEERRCLGLMGRQFVERYHDPLKIVRQYSYLYDFIKRGARNV